MYIFESKNYSGWIFGTETQKYWTQTLRQSGGGSEKNRFYNPIMQNKGHLKWIKKYLGELNIPIYSYIVFSERCTLKDITLTSNEHFVIKRDSILASVRKIAANAGEQLAAADIDALYEKLYPLTQLSEEQKEQHIENIQNNHPIGKMEVQKPAMAKQEAMIPEQETMASGQESVSLDQMSAPLEQSPDTPSLNSTDNSNVADKICPRCGGKLVLRTSSRGVHKGNQFWGCSNYPGCRYIENIEQKEDSLQSVQNAVSEIQRPEGSN